MLWPRSKTKHWDAKNVVNHKSLGISGLMKINYFPKFTDTPQPPIKHFCFKDIDCYNTNSFKWPENILMIDII